MKKIDKYSIGLDIGTNSVGWAVIDDNYHLLKHGGKNMWGVRLFDKGETAQARRVSRGNRRRLQRRKQRIGLLKELIGSMVLENDPTFFMRLEKGFETTEDKGYLYNLFNDSSFTDKDYYGEFPTIYHLRAKLISSNEKVDPRLIYLALHHIIKYRGNFLYEGQNLELSNHTEMIENLMNGVNGIFNDSELSQCISEDETVKILHILSNKNLKKKEKNEEVVKLLAGEDKESKIVSKEIANLLLGYKCNFNKLFPLIEVKKDDKDFSVDFSEKYDEEIDFIEQALGDSFEYVDLLHKVYGTVLLNSIMDGKTYISEAMLEKYKIHQADLKQLKSFIKENYDKKTYVKMFNDVNEVTDKKGNYYNYINNTGKVSKIEFYKYVNELLDSKSELQNNPDLVAIKEKIDQGIYMPKQNSKENWAIPYQLNQEELIKIIDNQGKYYPILKDNKEKLIKLIEFRVPYYVGPLNNHSEFAWIKRLSDERITPWDFDKQVDVVESAECFIRKMTNNCTYLLGEYVVPKKSLLYSKFEVLNELNKIRTYNDVLEKFIPLNIQLKQDIYYDVFMKKATVKEKDLRNYFRRNPECNIDPDCEIKGYQKEKEFASSLQPWIDFKKIYGEDFESRRDEIETIIEWLSLYQDKKILKKRIKASKFNLSSEQIEKLCKLINKYSGWGRLSKKLLVDLKGKDYKSIMDYLFETNMNFMQIINDTKLGFKDEIESITFEGVDNSKDYKEKIRLLQGSPALKKGIWQSMLVVDEISKVMGNKPSNIFMEFAREEQEKKRTDSRVKKLLEVYSAMVKENKNDVHLANVYGQLKEADSNKQKLNERLFLYYLQQGRCLYSNEPLTINQLLTCQVDHIIPQSLIKDDSIDNKALVLGDLNQYKGDQELLKNDTVKKMIIWWKHLKEYGLISAKKYANLQRTYLSEREEVGFINRQLVETRQITKHVANLLKEKYEDTNVVTVRADMSHNFRLKYNLYKVREINDYHHAHDAFLASTIGLFILKKYPILQKEFIFSDYQQIPNLREKINKQSKYGFVLGQMRDDKTYAELNTGEVIWNGSENIAYIKKAMQYKDCFITKKLEEKRGQLFDLTIDKVEKIRNIINEKPHKVIPVNSSRDDIEKYGGFTSLKYIYGVGVEYHKKGKVKKEVVNLPRHLANESFGKIKLYLLNDLNAEEVTIIKPKILLNQLFEYEGGLYRMSSATEWSSATQLVLSYNSIKTIYMLFNENENSPSMEEISACFDEYIEKLENYYPLQKKLANNLREKKEIILNLDNKDKISVFKELFKITKSSFANLKSIGLSSSTGRITNKTLYLDKANFISQSVTGLFSKESKWDGEQ